MSVLVKTILQVREQRRQQGRDIESLRLFMNNNFPDTIKALRQIDFEHTRPKRRKGFNLVIMDSKKYGRRIYARLSYEGKTLPTKFNTHTGDEKEAESYVLKNKERLIEGYLSRKDGRMYKTLECFYDGEQDNLSDRCRKEYGAVIRNKFIPFLKQEKIYEFKQITKIALNKFQDALLKTGITGNKKEYEPMRPQSVNNNMKAVRKIFETLTRQNITEKNTCDLVRDLPVKEDNRSPRGCYELERIKDVFNRKWKDELSYLLCAIIYTTGMRNGEIKRIKMNDMQLMDGCRFIKIKQSKTENGIRLIPLHRSLYEKIKIWGVKNKTGENPLFDVHAGKFNRANNELARRLKVSDEELERENITFYSGRHYWKTLMSAEGLGEDIEEVWMGHKVSGSVKKLYNHRDKQGRTRMVKKARQMFSILNRFIFKTKT
jgi:integrase